MTEPKISVVCPMYNVEDYVGECLDSLLVQTLKDFEVIIVDDCSTDNSREVVKNYQPKFDGRLRLIESEKNSGGCAVPRNIGISHATGKYLIFLDTDDLLTKTALAELYEVAEKFSADVVHCEKFYKSATPKLQGALLKVSSYQQGKFVTEPTLEEHDIAKKVTDFHNIRYIWTAWSKLVRREFMEKNQITFPPILNNEDLVFAMYCLFCAEKYVRVPNVVNIYRYRPESITKTKLDMASYARLWIRALINGFSACDKFLDGIDFFQKNPDYKYLALDCVAQDIFVRVAKCYRSLSAAQLDKILREEFAKSDASPALATFFFSMSILMSMQIGTHILNTQKNSDSTSN